MVVVVGSQVKSVGQINSEKKKQNENENQKPMRDGMVSLLVKNSIKGGMGMGMYVCVDDDRGSQRVSKGVGKKIGSKKRQSRSQSWQADRRRARLSTAPHHAAGS